MYTIILTFVLLGIFENKSCSLLSRLKNRYEYIPQENSVYVFTEDLYDFEFTNIHSTIKPSTLKVLKEIETADEDLYYELHNKLLNGSNPRHDVSPLKRTPINVKTFNQRIKIPITTEFFFVSRPTIKSSSLTTSSKLKKTWPTYFPRKTLTLPRTSGSSTTSQINTKAAIIKVERTSILPFILIHRPKQETQITTNATTMETRPITSTITEISSTSLHSTQMSTVTTYSNTTKTTPKMAKQQSLKSYCYRCGLNETRIPMANCYYTFEGDDKRYSRRKHRFKIKCIRSPSTKEIKNTVYGPSFRGGCFKRFLDVGIEYNERGCRTYLPTTGKSFASIRLAKIEHLLNDLDNGCVASPHASITAFSRAISLFARYHVCVCSRRYCNKAVNMGKHNVYKPFLFIVYAIFKTYILSYCYKF